MQFSNNSLEILCVCAHLCVHTRVCCVSERESGVGEMGVGEVEIPLAFRIKIELCLIRTLDGDASIQVGKEPSRTVTPAPPGLPHLRNVLQVHAIVPVEARLAVFHQQVLHLVGADCGVDPVVVDSREGEVLAHAVGEVVEVGASVMLDKLLKKTTTVRV